MKAPCVKCKHMYVCTYEPEPEDVFSYTSVSLNCRACEDNGMELSECMGKAARTGKCPYFTERKEARMSKETAEAIKTFNSVYVMPCPFCGGSAGLMCGREDGLSISCERCNCTTYFKNDATDETGKWSEALSIWNHRYAEDGPICPMCRGTNVERDEDGRPRSIDRKAWFCKDCRVWFGLCTGVWE